MGGYAEIGAYAVHGISSVSDAITMTKMRSWGSQDYAAVTRRGRPPFLPFSRAALDFASVDTLPAIRSSSEIHRFVPNMPAINCGTL